MVKRIIKELIIVLLLCLAIILVLGVLLYEYVPSSKVVPEKVAYTTPENVKIELEKAQDVDESQVIMTYQVDATEITNQKRINNYVPGKPNPFSSYSTEITNETNTTNGNSATGNNTTGNTTSSNSSSNENITSNGTSVTNNKEQNNTSQYFPNTGTK